MNFREAKKVEVGTYVYQKKDPKKEPMQVIERHVYRRDPSHAVWQDVVEFRCDDGNEYIHSDLYRKQDASEWGNGD